MRSFLFVFIVWIGFSLAYGQEWVRQNPFPQLSFMHGITMDENGKGWAVGGESIILHTDDYGTSWFSQEAPIQGWVIQSVAVQPNSNNQNLLAGGNSILTSSDGGENWAVANVNGSLQAIDEIQYVNENDVFAFGFTSAGYSTDGGDNWDILPSKPDITVISTGYFKTSQTGFLLGPGGDSQIYKTTDGAQNWTKIDESTIVQFPAGMQFLDNQTGYIFGRDYLYKTEDGGDTWTRTHPDVIPGSINGGKVVNENLIYLVTNNSSVYRSEDGGVNWTEFRPNKPGGRFKGVAADDDGRIWVAAQYSSILYSNNNGVDWFDQVGGNKNILRAVGFENDQLGWAVGNEGTVLRTDDGGAIWEDISKDESWNFFGMHFVDSENIWLCGSQGRIFRGFNNATRVNELSQIGSSGMEIHAVLGNIIVVADEDGNLYRSVDSGLSWTSVYNTTRRMMSVYFYDTQNGYAAGESGVLLTSNDGGLTWTERVNDPGREFVEIFPSTDQEVWALEYRGDSIWHSSDAGINWEQIKLPASSFWNEISFMNQDTGWICGGGSGNGVVYKTVDGGQTWAWDHSSQASLNGMTAPAGTEELAFAVGHGGNIVKFSRCNFAPVISNITGETTPCEGDTVSFQIDQEYVTNFEWDFPGSWLIVGNSNSAKVDVIAGNQFGLVLVTGSSECGVSGPLELIVDPVPVDDAVIEQQGDELVCLTNGAGYQWYNNQGLINGATSSTYTPAETGTYYVRVTFDNGCESKASNVITVTISSVQDLSVAGIQFYPNPTNDVLYFEIDPSVLQNELDFRIHDIHNRLVWEQNISSLNSLQSFDLSNLDAGLYFLLIRAEGKLYSDKLLIF